MQVRENVAVLDLGPSTQQDAIAVGKPVVAVAVVSFEADQAVGCGLQLALESGPETATVPVPEQVYLEQQQTKHGQ